MLAAKLGYATHTAKEMYLYSVKNMFCKMLPIIKVLRQDYPNSKQTKLFSTFSFRKYSLCVPQLRRGQSVQAREVKFSPNGVNVCIGNAEE